MVSTMVRAVAADARTSECVAETAASAVLDMSSPGRVGVLLLLLRCRTTDGSFVGMGLNYRGLLQYRFHARRSRGHQRQPDPSKGLTRSRRQQLMNSHSNDRDDEGFSPMEEAAAYVAVSQIALNHRSLIEALGEVAVLARRSLPETPAASVTVLSGDRPYTAAFQGNAALKLDERQYADGEGPCLHAAAFGGAVHVAMNDPDDPYPNFREAAQQEGITHSLSVGIASPGRADPGWTGGAALNLYSSTGSFTADSSRITGTIAGIAGIALTTVGRSDEAAAVAARLRQALASRALISRAQDILMAELHCSRSQAFTKLVSLSQEQQVRLHQAAQAVVDQPAGPTTGS
jgi:hypothetical protein